MQVRTTDNSHTEIQTAYGFVIRASQHELQVCRDSKAYDLKSKKKRFMVLLAGFIVSLLLFLSQVHYLMGSHSNSNQNGIHQILNWILSSLWTGIPIVAVLRWLYPNRVDLRCASECVEIEYKYLWRQTRLYQYPKCAVKQFRYVEAVASWIGLPSHVDFSANGKQITCLHGIGYMECQQILQALYRMGYEVQGVTPLTRP
jgi:hypothetical protein